MALNTSKCNHLTPLHFKVLNHSYHLISSLYSTFHHHHWCFIWLHLSSDNRVINAKCGTLKVLLSDGQDILPGHRKSRVVIQSLHENADQHAQYVFLQEAAPYRYTSAICNVSDFLAVAWQLRQWLHCRKIFGKFSTYIFKICNVLMFFHGKLWYILVYFFQTQENA